MATSTLLRMRSRAGASFQSSLEFAGAAASEVHPPPTTTTTSTSLGSSARTKPPITTLPAASTGAALVGLAVGLCLSAYFSFGVLIKLFWVPVHILDQWIRKEHVASVSDMVEKCDLRHSQSADEATDVG